MKEVEGELARQRATVTEIERVVNSMAGELKQKNRELKTSEEVMTKQVSELDAVKARVVDMEVANAGLEKVSFDLSSHFFF